MAGKPGSGGPVPKRTAERRRRNQPATPVTSAPGAISVPVPDADESWHPIAIDWFESLKASGQSAFYEPSDWQTARYVAESMSRNLLGARFSAQLFAATMAAMTELLTTEGARRRMRMELERAEPEPDKTELAAVERIADARARMESKKTG